MRQFQKRRLSRRIPVRGSNRTANKDLPDKIQPEENQPEPPPVVIKAPVVEPARPAPETESEPIPAAETDWQAVALRQKAEMDNFRKRQSRRADGAIRAERDRLLRLILPVADNLDRALKHDNRHDELLRKGVELTQRELHRLLQAEGVTRIETVGQPFDPEWHEALATVSGQAEANTVVEEIEAGYKLGNKLLRPAKVVVAI